MRPSSLAFAVACAVALPSGAALFGAGLSVCLPLIGVGLGLGLAIMAALDWRDYMAGRTVDLEDLKTRTYAVYLSNLEREQKLNTPPVEPPVLPPDDPEPEPPVSPYPDRWATFWRRVGQAGDALGWTQAALKPVMSEDTWDMATDALIANGWLTAKRVGIPTKWAVEGGLTAFEQAEAWKALPAPPENPPVIALPPYRAATPQRRRTTTEPEKRVIDGVRAD